MAPVGFPFLLSTTLSMLSKKLHTAEAAAAAALVIGRLSCMKLLTCVLSAAAFTKNNQLQAIYKFNC